MKRLAFDRQMRIALSFAFSLAAIYVSSQIPQQTCNTSGLQVLSWLEIGAALVAGLLLFVRSGGSRRRVVARLGYALLFALALLLFNGLAFHYFHNDALLICHPLYPATQG